MTLGFFILYIYVMGLFIAPCVLKRFNDKYHWMTKRDITHEGGSMLCLLAMFAILVWPIVMVIFTLGEIFKLLLINLFPDV
jgi:multisubunit Na+/H+ antiporter MnhG subunit